jgi:hypothetical protein
MLILLWDNQHTYPITKMKKKIIGSCIVAISHLMLGAIVVALPFLCVFAED